MCPALGMEFSFLPLQLSWNLFSFFFFWHFENWVPNASSSNLVWLLGYLSHGVNLILEDVGQTLNGSCKVFKWQTLNECFHSLGSDETILIVLVSI